MKTAGRQLKAREDAGSPDHCTPHTPYHRACLLVDTSFNRLTMTTLQGPRLAILLQAFTRETLPDPLPPAYDLLSSLL